jgi:hypothetical protein
LKRKDQSHILGLKIPIYLILESSHDGSRMILLTLKDTITQMQ